MDEGFRLDDPNNRWGDPAYQLEPGDPGFRGCAKNDLFHALTKQKRQAEG